MMFYLVVVTMNGKLPMVHGAWGPSGHGKSHELLSFSAFPLPDSYTGLAKKITHFFSLLLVKGHLLLFAFKYVPSTYSGLNTLPWS